MGIVTCVSGIDTDIGKTLATGLMAKTLQQSGYSVITQKIVQTGCSGIAEDIVAHRELMGIALQPEDMMGITCPYVFEKACSPHLAAELENKTIDTKKITEATEKLLVRFDYVLLEGAGGLQVPLTRELTLLDYLQEKGYPLILVSSSRLGSINHTLSALELVRNRGMRVNGIVYNLFDTSDSVIAEDSRNVFLMSLQKYGFPARLITLEPKINYSRDGMQFPCLQLFDL